jgi:hypothetical protein
MKKTKEKQITAYEGLVRICETFGARYNPSNDAIKPTALSTLLEQAQQSVEAVTVAQQAKTFVVSDRAEAYAGIPKLATRIFHAMAASEAPEKTLEDAMQIRQALEYHAPKAKTLPAEGNAESAKRSGNPAAQLNFEAKARNFSRLIACVKTLPSYAPSEPDLKVDALEAFHARLLQLTKAVIRKSSELTEARIQRNAMLFGEKGIHGIAQAVKHYMRSAFRHDSEEAVNVVGIPFHKR